MTEDPQMLYLLSEAAQPSLAEIRQDQEGAPPRLAKMLEYLAGALFDPMLNVQTWKAALGVRDNSIAIHFHGFFGVPPKAYITRHRLATAKRLLCRTPLKVWQIGLLLGYSSLGVFSKAFARETGQRPRVYRTHRARREVGNSPDFSNAERHAALLGRLPAERAEELVGRILSMYPGLVPPPTVGNAERTSLVEGEGAATC